MRTILVIMTIFAAVAAGAEQRKPKTVTLDVKDADVREILKSMQKQCGIRNLIIDREVGGAGTFYFREVPCETAFRVVLRSFGLASRPEVNSVLQVGARKP